MTRSPSWISWIGLPAVEGSDPRAGFAGCCFQMAGIVREDLGLPWPRHRMPEWYRRAWSGDWEFLRNEWELYTYPCKIQPGAITFMDRKRDDMAFGVGVLVDERTMLTTTPESGVIAVPRLLWESWEFRDVREVAP